VRIADAFEIAPGALEFLQWATRYFACRWLSGRCRYGDTEAVRRAFRLAGAPLGSDPRWTIIDLITPARWGALKTEGIHLDSNFLWIDDAPQPEDISILEARGLRDRLLVVSVDSDPSALRQARRSLQKCTGLGRRCPAGPVG
jgi:hypothetical protein